MVEYKKGIAGSKLYYTMSGKHSSRYAFYNADISFRYISEVCEYFGIDIEGGNTGTRLIDIDSFEIKDASFVPLMPYLMLEYMDLNDGGHI